jgi:hypothetical protein
MHLRENFCYNFMHLGTLFQEAELTTPNCVGWNRVLFLEETLQIRKRVNRWKTNLVNISRWYSASATEIIERCMRRRPLYQSKLLQLLILFNIQNPTITCSPHKSYTSKDFEIFGRIPTRQTFQSRRNNCAQRSPSRIANSFHWCSKSLPCERWNRNKVRDSHRGPHLANAALVVSIQPCAKLVQKRDF